MYKGGFTKSVPVNWLNLIKLIYLLIFFICITSILYDEVWTKTIDNQT
jgi:cbb3-type cytochrome oxidase subunit 3